MLEGDKRYFFLYFYLIGSIIDWFSLSLSSLLKLTHLYLTFCLTSKINGDSSNILYLIQPLIRNIIHKLIRFCIKLTVFVMIFLSILEPLIL